MKKPKPSKLMVKVNEQKAEDEFLWGHIRHYENLSDHEGALLLSIGQKQLKRELVAWAEKVANEFWSVHNKHLNGEGVEKEYGEYGVRVIEQSWTLQIQWYRAVGVNKGSFLKYESMNKPSKGSGSYSLSRFKNAKDWELDAIQKAEVEFGKIRRCSDHLKNMFGAFRGIEQIFLMHELVRIKDRDS